MSPSNESVKKWDDISKSDEKKEEMYIYKLPKKRESVLVKWLLGKFSIANLPEFGCIC